MSSASAPGAAGGSTSCAARMLEVIGFSVQPAGTATENGPSANRPSGSFSSVRGPVLSGIGPPMSMPACGFPLPPMSMPACGFPPTPGPCGLALGLAPACGLSCGGAVGLLPPEALQSLAGGRPFDESFLHEAAGANARTSVTAARRRMSRNVPGSAPPFAPLLAEAEVREVARGARGLARRERVHARVVDVVHEVVDEVGARRLVRVARAAVDDLRAAEVRLLDARR